MYPPRLQRKAGWGTGLCRTALGKSQNPDGLVQQRHETLAAITSWSSMVAPRVQWGLRRMLHGHGTSPGSDIPVTPPSYIHCSENQNQNEMPRPF